MHRNKRACITNHLVRQKLFWAGILPRYLYAKQEKAAAYYLSESALLRSVKPRLRLHSADDNPLDRPANGVLSAGKNNRHIEPTVQAGAVLSKHPVTLANWPRGPTVGWGNPH